MGGEPDLLPNREGSRPRGGVQSRRVSHLCQL